jgi:hypothetical protein
MEARPRLVGRGDGLGERPPDERPSAPEHHVEVDARTVDGHQFGLFGFDTSGGVSSDEQHGVGMVGVEVLERLLEGGGQLDIELGGRHVS